MPYDITEELETVWDALHAFREDLIPEGEEMYDEQWDNICTSMSRITESLGYEINQDGDYVIVPEEEQNA
jgi:transcriptional regulator of met regulon|tara:strand:+ start:259 stop:468 length:210 start_codon:yes stop_codon:yes gene_type:complete